MRADYGVGNLYGTKQTPNAQCVGLRLTFIFSIGSIAMKTALDHPPAAHPTRSLAMRAGIDWRRRDFPVLNQLVHGRPLVYLDNAATTQKPQAVLDALEHYYRHDNANVHRGVHALSQRATDSYEGARARVRDFLRAREAAEIVFVRGATEAINLVAQSFVRPTIGPGDQIIVSELEHHSNIVPWQVVCQQTGATLRVIPINSAGEVQLDDLAAMLTSRTRFIAVSHVSNALGSVTDVRHVIELAHARGVPVLVDGAQAIAHQPVDVQALDCDFYVFSGHKCYAPTGIGVLYGKAGHLRAMPPYQTGGDMVRTVSFAKSDYMDIPNRFEAGTPDIAGAVGMAAAVDYLDSVGMAAIAAHEDALLEYATAQMSAIAGLTIIGTARRKSGILSFTLAGVHPHDIGTVLDREGVAIRTGHHCAMPAMEHFGLASGTARAAFALYNNHHDVDALVAATRGVCRMFQ
jgi:cysteine desulfurase/selenocysteine lyase